MSIKMLYATDIHAMGRNPGGRIDNYPEALFKKVLELEHVCRVEKMDALIIGGDFFDSAKIADSIKNRYMKVFRRIRKNGTKIFWVPGNHDEIGYTLDTLEQTAMGIFSSAGVVRLLTKDKPVEFKKGNILLGIHGREYDKYIDQDPVNDYQINPIKGAHHDFLFSHGMVLKKPFHPDVAYTLTKDIVTQADLVMNGHYHPGFELHEENGTLFGNPGSTGRDEASKDNYNRIPQYAVIEATKDDFEVEYVEYQVAQAGKDIFDITAIKKHKAEKRYLEAFEQTIADAVTFDAYDPKDILDGFLKQKAITQEVYDAALDAIVAIESLEKKNKLDGYVEKLKNIGIKSIELTNFQSHKHTLVEFDPTGVNAITGASDSGKSAIVRALRWVFYNEPKGTEFIRHGESRATVTVTFTDGSSITRTRTNSSAGEYSVTKADGTVQEFKGFGNDLPIEIANTHQMPKVELSTGLERSLNFSYQLDGHFLLSESPATRAATIGRLTGVHLVDAAIKEKAKDIRNITSDIKTAEKEIAIKDEKIAQYSDLEDTEKLINTVKGYLLGLESLEKEIRELSTLKDTYEQSIQEQQVLSNELQRYQSLPQAELLLQKAELLFDEIEILSDLHDDYRKAKADISILKVELEDYEELDNIPELMTKAEEVLGELQELKDLYNTYNDLDEEVEFFELEIKDYADLKKADGKLTQAEELLNEINELKALQGELEESKSKVEKFEYAMSSIVVEINGIQQEMDEVLLEMGNRCPTCNQQIMDSSVLLEHIGE